MVKAPRRRPARRGMLGKEAIHPGRPRNSTGRRAYYWRRRLTPAIQAPPDDSSSGLSSAQCRERGRVFRDSPAGAAAGRRGATETPPAAALGHDSTERAGREAHRRSSGSDPTARAPDEGPAIVRFRPMRVVRGGGTRGGAKTPRRRAVPRTVTGRATEAGSIYNRPYAPPRPPPSSRPRPRRRSSWSRPPRRAGSPAGTRRRRRARTPGSGSSSP